MLARIYVDTNKEGKQVVVCDIGPIKLYEFGSVALCGRYKLEDGGEAYYPYSIIGEHVYASPEAAALLKKIVDDALDNMRVDDGLGDITTLDLGDIPAFGWSEKVGSSHHVELDPEKQYTYGIEDNFSDDFFKAVPKMDNETLKNLNMAEEVEKTRAEIERIMEEVLSSYRR